jgi:plastocyanin
MKTKTLLVPALVSLAVGLASCGGGDDTTSPETETETVTEGESPAAAQSPSSEADGGSGAQGEKLERAVKVEIVNFAYGPDPVRVQAGGKVIWQNMDSAPHTATADDGSFDTGALEEGKLRSETFKRAGIYAYHCEIHPEMQGKVEVIEPE